MKQPKDGNCMKKQVENLSEKRVKLSLEGVDAKIIYHLYNGFKVDTLLVSFVEKRRVLSTLDGYKEVSYVANTYSPPKLAEQTMVNYSEFKRSFPAAIGIDPLKITFLNTGVDIDNLAVREQSFEEFKVCCLATAGAKDNAMRTGVDVTSYVERDGRSVRTLGTINLILLTNATLSEGAMARSIITATEAKTAALQDLGVKSTFSPQYQATGTGTDNMVIVSGKMGKPLRVTSGHTKMSELIGFATKNAVTEALKNYDG